MENNRIYPKIEKAYSIIGQYCFEQMTKLYGNNPPELITDRLDKEMNFVENSDFAVTILTARHIAKKYMQNDCLVDARGTAGSSFINFLLGISRINPLPAHQHCLKCKTITFMPEADSGFDLSGKPCVKCGKEMEIDGHNIPFESFFGMNGEKRPSVDIEVSNTMFECSFEILGELFSDAIIAKHGFVDSYTKKLKTRPNCHYIIPEKYKDAEGLEYTKTAAGIPVIVSNNGFELQERLFAQYILPQNSLFRLEVLANHTGVSNYLVPMNDIDIYTAFSSCNTQTIPMFYTDFSLKILIACKPKCFSDLIKIAGLLNCNGGWLDNADLILKDNIASLSEIISNREDVYNILIENGQSRETAYEIMTNVSRGKSELLSKEEFDAYNLPDWYYDSCEKINYLSPKAHIVNHVKIAVQLMWYKLNFPAEYNKVTESFLN